ncbi:MAG: symmetrical bis(5'-nucleosyl)-tetraphosphatase [Gammaproteobacteria bacterium]|nr:symmetrical bis(5'-nucleosyl)-tetraphosphatase [Gammaproteobacteria bacterium]
MATYAIGDLQGCYREFRALLDKLHFDPAQDYLWLVGDLVNRGPQSLETLRYVKNLGAHCITVLGNHDLSLLATLAGIRPAKNKDTTGDILHAKDREELFYWLRQQPLFHHDPQLNFSMVHAGLPPQWTIDEALIHAQSVSNLLRSDEYLNLLGNMYGDEPAQWSDDLVGMPRYRYIINALTRMRFCTIDGALDLEPKGAPGSQAPGLLPWFDLPERRSASTRIVFGHWSALSATQRHDAFALDSGCVWGQQLTAMQLDHPDLIITQQSCINCKNN